MIRSEQKVLVIKLYRAKKAGRPKILYKQMIAELMAETGIGKTSIQKMISEYNRNKTVSSPNTTKARPKLVEKFDERDLNAIRRRVHRFWRDREPPTMDKVLRAVTEDRALPTVKRTSMYRLLKDLNFEFTRRKRSNGGVVLTERDDVVAWRRRYLRSVRSCRADGRPVYYVAEARCAGGGGGCERLGLAAVHIGSRDGFVDGGLLCVESSSSSEAAARRKNGPSGATGSSGAGDPAVDGAGFLKWFEAVLPRLPDRAVVVMDSAAYNSARVDTVPDASWKKTNVIKWLHEKRVPVDDTYVRPELFDLVRRTAADGGGGGGRYVVDEAARAANKTVLRLPPYHGELNAMELAWSAVLAGGPGHRDRDRGLHVTRSLLAEAVDAVTEEQWRRFDEQTVDEEDRLWELDRLVDDFLENDDCATCIFTFDTDESSSCDTDF